MIDPHGGKLVNRMLEGNVEAARKDASSLPVIDLNNREASDLALLANGAFSPLEGFMDEKTYHSVLDDMRLSDGTLWSLPITLSIKDEALTGRSTPFDAALRSPEGEIVGTIRVEGVYAIDKEEEARKSLLTADGAHPGVQYLDTVSGTCAGGAVTLFERPQYPDYDGHDLDPAETRKMFESKGWSTVVAFQTRNPIHRAHEYLQKCALEMVDGLLIHPIVGETKSDDIPPDVRMHCYHRLMDNYFSGDHVGLVILPAAMRYAGPREAIFHAIMRQNYGCTHFIVGRDHAGVGDYYGTYDAQKIFGTIEPDDLAIRPVFFEHSFYCKRCGGMASKKTCPHDGEDHVFLSGTKVREMLKNGDPLPGEFTRREVAEVLERFYAPAKK